METSKHNGYQGVYIFLIIVNDCNWESVNRNIFITIYPTNDNLKKFVVIPFYNSVCVNLLKLDTHLTWNFEWFLLSVSTIFSTCVIIKKWLL